MESPEDYSRASGPTYSAESSQTPQGEDISNPAVASLPAELLLLICSHLDAVDLASVAQVSVQFNEIAQDDRIWQRLLQKALPSQKFETEKTGPLQCSRSTYLAHNPYWFIPRSKIWFSDRHHHGRLVIARYSPSRRVIEAYELTAMRGAMGLEFWSHNPNVMIHNFHPTIQLDLNRPVVRIAAASPHNFPSDDRRFQREIEMNVDVEPQGAAMFRQLGLCKSKGEIDLDEDDMYWPHRNIPAAERVLGDAGEAMRIYNTHSPTRLSDICENAFRIRRWISFSSSLGIQNMRLGEEVSTYATLAPADYTPTPQKPWRGIWVGDYASHGCEFLLVLQPDEPVQLPRLVREIFNKREQRRRVSSNSSNASWRTALDEMADEEEIVSEWMMEAASEEWLGPRVQQTQMDYDSMSRLSQQGAETNDHTHTTARPSPLAHASSSPANNTQPSEIESSGQLLAVKLTGDPNVPRGEYSFVCPETGPDGLIRIAQEERFKGARVLRSTGHVADHNFVDEGYLPSQLILVNKDTLAQYWEAFGHISFYRRVDIDRFTGCD